MNFAENLRVLREKNNMTQEQLAERMEVSRQTVSKWESEASLPEMEKLILLTEIFGCTMDGLLKGDLKQVNEGEAKQYDRHGNWVARTGALATGICILSLAAQALAECTELTLLKESGLPFLLGALIGALLWVRVGMEGSHFRRKHFYVEPFYTEEEKENFHRKYVTFMITGIGILIAALIVAAGLSTAWPDNAAQMENVAGTLFLIMTAVGVSVIVYIALMASKYNVEGYNEDNAWETSEEGKENSRRIGKTCGVIMLIAVICTIVIWMCGPRFKISTGIPTAVGGILCGVAAIVLNRRKR